MKKIGFWILPLVFLAVCAAPIAALSRSDGEQIAAGWKDEFTDKNPRWDWPYIAGTGYRQLVQLPDAPSALEIGVKAKGSQAGTYSDSSLHETAQRIETGILEMRLRLSHRTAPQGGGVGTRGWGFWDGSKSSGDVAWFWEASQDSSPELVGLRAQVVRQNDFLLNQPLQIDPTEWHVYRIEMAPSYTRFLVDGAEVARAEGKPANRQRVEIWVDNLIVRLAAMKPQYGYLVIPEDLKMWIDWVRYLPLNPDATPPPAPTATPLVPTPTPRSSPGGTFNFDTLLPLVVRE